MEDLKTLKVELDEATGIGHLILNRPSQRNALDTHFFTEFPRLLSALDENSSVRIIILKSAGNHFCSGIDLSTLTSVAGSQGENHDDDGGRVREKLRRNIKNMQAALSAVEECRKPVIAAIHGACIGAGVDLITACDIRYCSEDASFCVKEVDIAIAADLGTLQRLPRLVGDGNARELSLTGRRIDALEAKHMGLVQKVYPTKSDMDENVYKIARDIAAKSPLAVIGTKAVLLNSRDLSVDKGLDYVATWNAAMLSSTDVQEVFAAQVEKRKPMFSKL